MTASENALARAMGVDKEATEGLADAASDSGLVHSFWLLTQVVQAARTDDFVGALARAGMAVRESPTLFDLTAAFATTVHDAMWRNGKPTDVGEMARMAAIETITTFCRASAPGLFTEEPPDLQQSLRALSSPLGFSRLAEECFSRFTRRYLLYLLSRELSVHIGPGKRFGDLRERTAFNDALDTHCRQVSRIVREFAGGWYSKRNYEGGITLRNARGFSYVALRKIRSEMGRR